MIQLVSKRHELALLMDYESYAAYTTSRKMSKNPEAVWNFLNDLIARSGEKAQVDLQTLQNYRNQVLGCNCDDPVNPWDRSYYRNQLLISKYKVDQEDDQGIPPYGSMSVRNAQHFRGMPGSEIQEG